MGNKEKFIQDLNEGQLSVVNLLKKYHIPISVLKETRDYKKVRHALSEEDALEYAINRNVSKVKKRIKD